MQRIVAFARDMIAWIRSGQSYKAVCGASPG
jgi:hypothetical protein